MRGARGNSRPYRDHAPRLAVAVRTHPARGTGLAACSQLTIERANNGCAAAITYIPIGRGFSYLVAIIDMASREVLA